MEGFEKGCVSEDGAALLSKNKLRVAGGLTIGLCPYFEERVLQDQGETEVL